MSNPDCPYCGQESMQGTGVDVYPHRPDLQHLVFYICDPCNARVGCHPGTTQALGSLANAELRQTRSQVHIALDRIWASPNVSRSEVYKWLAGKMELSASQCHIGKMDVNQCNEAITFCNERK